MTQKRLSHKEKKKIYKANKFYDKYMSGKYNPELGDYNFDLTPVKTRKVLKTDKKFIFCSCGNTIYVSSITSGFICSKCGMFNEVK